MRKRINLQLFADGGEGVQQRAQQRARQPEMVTAARTPVVQQLTHSSRQKLLPRHEHREQRRRP